MSSLFVRETVENWVADFLHADAARAFEGEVVEYAQEILTSFLVGACAVRGVEPSDVVEADLRTSLLGDVAALELSSDVRSRVPDLCAALLEDLESAGRLGGGRALGLFVRALRKPFLAASGGVRTPERRVAPKIGPNEPCPCGSGRKFKHCCK